MPTQYRRRSFRISYHGRIKLVALLIIAITIGTMMVFVTQADAARTGSISMTEVSLGDTIVRKEVTESTAVYSSNIVTTEFTSPSLIKSAPEVKQLPYIEEDIDPMKTLEVNLGNTSISVGSNTLQRYDLPNKYYPGIDFSSFQPYMDYRCITNKNSPAYAVSHSELAYTDEYGMRRYKTSEDQFTIDGNDDYVIALGTFYKEKGTAGSRYLIVTSTGKYTAIAGDEKADSHTDSRHMFSLHQDGTGGIIEWIVDQRTLEIKMKRSGTITAGPIEPLQGEILHIYKIQ